MTTPNPCLRAYLGGSFNPPHFGHLLMAQAVADTLATTSTPALVHFMPSHNPHKDPFSHQSNDNRLALITLALADFNHTHTADLRLETCEILSDTYPTYTLDTLQTLQNKHPDDTLIFVMGQDSFENLPKWKGGFDVLNHCHLWVFGRQGGLNQTSAHGLHGDFATFDELIKFKTGKIYWDNRTIPDISSTYIRNTLQELWQNNAPLDAFYDKLAKFLPKRVLDKIFDDRFYQN